MVSQRPRRSLSRCVPEGTEDTQEAVAVCYLHVAVCYQRGKANR